MPCAASYTATHGDDLVPPIVKEVKKKRSRIFIANVRYELLVNKRVKSRALKLIVICATVVSVFGAIIKIFDI